MSWVISMFVFLSSRFPDIVCNLTNCGSLEFQPCKIKNYGHFRGGYTCKDEENTCVPSKSWCTLNDRYMDGTHCTNYENLMFESCMSVDTRINGKKYLVSTLLMDWEMAEQFCQYFGMHLFSISDQKEFDHVLKFLQRMSDHPKNLMTDHIMTLHDPLAQRCWEGLHLDSLKYWTGIYFDILGSSSWVNTDGRIINPSISTMATSLSSILQKSGKLDHISFYDRNFTFNRHSHSQTKKSIDVTKDKARPVCKQADNFTEWYDRLPRSNDGCITGFKCAGSEPECLIGPDFLYTQVCDGKKDCLHGDDESNENCRFFERDFPDGMRTAYVLPYPRPLAVVKRLCSSSRHENWTLPSIQSIEDIKFLLSLPGSYAKNVQEKSQGRSFDLISENWTNLQWMILLGLKDGGKEWDDGSPVHDAPYLPIGTAADSDLYLDSEDSRLKYIFDQKKEIFVVCQRRWTINTLESKPLPPSKVNNVLGCSTPVLALIGISAVFLFASL